MSVQPNMPPLPVRQNNGHAERHAAALAEIKQMEQGYNTMMQENTSLRRSMDAALNKIGLLEEALADSRHAERVYRNKLIHLASAMANIGLLSREAEQIMRDAKETEEADARRLEEAAEARSDREAGDGA